jgi:hypothetical protein
MRYYNNNRTREYNQVGQKEHEDRIRHLQEYLRLTDDEDNPENNWALKPWNKPIGGDGKFYCTQRGFDDSVVNSLLIRKLSLILEEMRSLRVDLETLRRPERERKDYTLPLGSACLAVLVLILLFK